MDQFIKHIKSVHPLSQQTINEFSKILIEKKYLAKYLICKIGITPHKISFLKSGIARIFIVLPKEKEYNKAIFTSGDIIGCFTGLISKKPSKYTIECLTDCEVIEFEYEKFISLVENNNDLASFHIKNLEKLYLTNYKRSLDHLTLNATERYLELREQIIDIDILIPQKQIANHLAITSIQLSRIRKKLKNI
ncbi:MAG: CRP-like cAMP-binding protein [Urechidicola sp.]|jgi:CRP-like cAMP-binding protein|tara:strand:+ start:2664 stop:3239 length:576 start_codon:yes stop_codon:yes gene_type:complete